MVLGQAAWKLIEVSDKLKGTNFKLLVIRGEFENTKQNCV